MSGEGEENQPTMDVEKKTVTHVEGTYIVTRDAEEKSGLDLRTTPDGKIVLIPQPSDDPADPLNWSWTKKHTVLFALGFSALLTDWGMTWGTTLFEAQALTWNMSIPDVAKSLSGGIFLQGPGGILAVPLVQRYGRLVFCSSASI